MPRVSVIIPAYNAEKYIRHCILSVLSQSEPDIEIIVIDDGSTDSTTVIIEELIEEDCRIRLIKNQHFNAGVSRNTGIDLAQGKYLYFLDADDFIDKSLITKMANVADETESDIVVCRSHYYDDVTKESSPIDFSMINVPTGIVLSGDKLPQQPFQSFVGWPWDKLFRKSFVEEKALRFQSLRSSNDALFVFLALCEARCMICLSDDLVSHRTNNKGSLEHTRSKSWNNAIAAMKALKDEIISRGLKPRVWTSYANWVAHFSYWSMASLDSNSLDREIVKTFDLFLSTVNLNANEYYTVDDREFAQLSHSDRLDAIQCLIRSRSRKEDQIRILSAEKQILENRCLALENAQNELDLMRKSMSNDIEVAPHELPDLYRGIKNSYSYRIGHALLSPLRVIRRLICRN